LSRFKNYPLFKNINEDTFLISDTHFGDKDVVKYEPKRKLIAKEAGFKSTDEQIYEELKKITLSKKKPVLLHLGDLTKSRKVKKGENFIPKGIDGILLKGNHDKMSKTDYLMSGFKKVIDTGIICSSFCDFIHQENNVPDLAYIIANISGIKVMFSHFPVYDNNKYDLEDSKIANTVKILEYLFEDFGCQLNIHGHIHSKTAKEKFCINCSIDITGNKPVRVGDIIDEAKRKNLLKF